MERGQDVALLPDAQQPWLPTERAPPGQQSRYCPHHRSLRLLSAGPRAGSHIAKRKVPFWFPQCPELQHTVKCGEHLFLRLFLLIPVSSLLSHYLLGDAFIAASITAASECITGRQKALKGLIFFPTLSFCFCISTVFMTIGCEAMKIIVAGSEQGRELLLQAYTFL